MMLKPELAYKDENKKKKFSTCSNQGQTNLEIYELQWQWWIWTLVIPLCHDLNLKLYSPVRSRKRLQVCSVHESFKFLQRT